MRRSRLFLPAFVLLLGVVAAAQQAPGSAPENQPPLSRPAYEPDKGPVVAIDEAHTDRHPYSRLQGLVRLLGRDGYRVRPFAENVSSESLQHVDVLVFVNPGGWEGKASLNGAEVASLLEWVRAGGSLLLILGHMPGPAFAEPLTAALGVEKWHDGFAGMNTAKGPVSNIRFQHVGRQPDAHVIPLLGNNVAWQGPDAVLHEHAVTTGRSAEERVESVLAFSGSAFQLPEGAEPLLVLPQKTVSLQPAWLPEESRWAPVTPQTPRTPVGGWSQGAVMKLGKGRVALFASAGIFSVQWPVHPAAAHNYKFVLNVMRWLTGVL